MRVRTPQILLVAALVGVCLLLWEVVLTPDLPASRGAEDAAAFGEADLLGAEREAERVAPTLAGRSAGLDAEARAARLTAAAAAADADGRAGSARATGARVPFRGRVLAPDGRPAGAVQIILQGPGGSETIQTDANGRFDHLARPGRYSLFFDAKDAGGLQVRSWMLDGAAREDLEFALKEPAALTVNVLRGAEGVAGARVVATALQGVEQTYGADTDVDGNAVFEAIVPGRYQLTAEVPDGPRLEHRTNATAGGQVTVRVRVPDSVVLKGRVQAGADGPGVAGASITLKTRPRRSQGLFETIFESGPDGRFEVTVPRGRPTQFLVSAEGYAPWPTEGQRSSVLKSLRGLTRANPVTRNVVLRGGAALSGVVRSEDEVGLAGIALRLKPRRGPVAAATTQEGGRYAVAQLNPGRYTVQVETPAHFPVRGQAMQVAIPGGASPEPQTLDITLVAARRLEGVVVQAGGEPAAGARVWIVGGGREVRSARDAGRVLETFTEATGRWVIADIPPDRDVTVRAAMGTLEADPVSAPHARPPPQPLRLTLKSTGVLRGTVADVVSRSSIAGVRVRAQPDTGDGRTGFSVVTDERGEFLKEGVMPGGWKLTPSKRGYLAAQAESVQVGRGEATRAHLHLDPGEVFAGRVTDEAGQPIAWARVTVRGTPRDAPKPVSRSRNANANGEFRLTGFAAGLYEVSGWRRNYRRARVQNLRQGDDRMHLVLRKNPAR